MRLTFFQNIGNLRQIPKIQRKEKMQEKIYGFLDDLI